MHCLLIVLLVVRHLFVIFARFIKLFSITVCHCFFVFLCLYNCFVTSQSRQLFCQVLRPFLYATGGRRRSEIIYPGLTPHHGPVFSLHQRLPASSLHLSLSPELSSDGWHQLPRKTTFPAAAASHYTSTPLLDEWWHSYCRSFRSH